LGSQYVSGLPQDLSGIEHVFQGVHETDQRHFPWTNRKIQHAGHHARDAAFPNSLSETRSQIHSQAGPSSLCHPQAKVAMSSPHIHMPITWLSPLSKTVRKKTFPFSSSDLFEPGPPLGDGRVFIDRSCRIGLRRKNRFPKATSPAQSEPGSVPEFLVPKTTSPTDLTPRIVPLLVGVPLRIHRSPGLSQRSLRNRYRRFGGTSRDERRRLFPCQGIEAHPEWADPCRTPWDIPSFPKLEKLPS